MCVVSNIGNGFKQDWPTQWPHVDPLKPIEPQVSREEFNQLKRQMEELKELLKAAKKYDEATGQPDCEQGDKVELILKLAEQLGVEISIDDL